MRLGPLLALVIVLAATSTGCFRSDAICHEGTDFGVVDLRLTPSVVVPGDPGPYVVEVEMTADETWGAAEAVRYRLFDERGGALPTAAWWALSGKTPLSPFFTWEDPDLPPNEPEGYLTLPNGNVVWRQEFPSPVDAGAAPGRYILMAEARAGAPSPCYRASFLELTVVVP